MIASAPNMKIRVQTASITCQDTSDEMRSVSLMTREWMYPTLFRLKNENDSVWRWLNAARRSSRDTFISMKNAR